MSASRVDPRLASGRVTIGMEGRSGRRVFCHAL